jgi:hypothetical protein
MMPDNITGSTIVNYCDWYEENVGYAFTTLDNDIGAVIANHGMYGVNANLTFNLTGLNYSSTLLPLSQI